MLFLLERDKNRTGENPKCDLITAPSTYSLFFDSSCFCLDNGIVTHLVFFPLPLSFYLCTPTPLTIKL